MILFVLAGSTQVHGQDLQRYLPAIEKTGGWYVTESSVVSGSDVKAGIVYAIIDTPHHHLVEILRDYDRYRELIPFLSHSKVIARPTDRSAQLKLRAKILKGALKLKAIVSADERTVSDARTQFTLKKRKGNLDRLDASFIIEKLAPSRSIVQIKLLLDPDVWYVRDATLSEYNQVNARRIARALKKCAGERPVQALQAPSLPSNKAPAAAIETKPVAPRPVEETKAVPGQTIEAPPPTP